MVGLTMYTLSKVEFLESRSLSSDVSDIISKYATRNVKVLDSEGVA